MRKLNTRLTLRRETLSELTAPGLSEAAGGTILPVTRFPFSPLCVSTWPTCFCTIVV